MTKTLIIWDVEWQNKKLEQLLSQSVIENIKWLSKIILAWDVVWPWKGNIKVLNFLMDNQERVELVLWNKDYLVQQLINWRLEWQNTKKWVENLAKKLDKNQDLSDYFMNSFQNYIQIPSEWILVCHAPIRWNRPIDDYSREELIGNTPTEWKKFNQKWTMLVHGHTPRKEGPILKHNKKYRILSVWIDTGAWKWGDLSGMLISKNKMQFISS